MQSTHRRENIIARVQEICEHDWDGNQSDMATAIGWEQSRFNRAHNGKTKSLDTYEELISDISDALNYARDAISSDEPLFRGQDNGEAEISAPPEDEEESQYVREIRATIYGEVGASDDTLILARDEARSKIVTVTRWNRDFDAPPGAEGHGYWIVRGRSAAPVFFEGEAVPVDVVGPTQKFQPGEVYIFRWRDHMYLKCLFPEGSGVYAQSLNPAVRDLRFTPENGEDFQVWARVRMPPKQQMYTSLLGDKLQPNR